LERDQLKAELCYQIGIDLLVVTDEQWELEKGKEMILNFMGERGYENLLG
jgi:hypothetical protein